VDINHQHHPMAATRGSPLLASVEALFENTESIVIAAFQVGVQQQEVQAT
jgi:hypothetical protein